MTLEYKLSENRKTMTIDNTELDKKFEYALGGSISILNKYESILEFSQLLSDSPNRGKEYNEWLWDILHKYDEAYKIDLLDKKPGSERFKLIFDNIDKIKGFVDSFYQYIEFDFEKFADISNLTKGSIQFNTSDIKTILYVSAYMKIYCLISYSTKKALGLNLHRKIYNEITNDFVSTSVVEKIYNVVKTKTYKYNMTDRSMWEYLKNFQGKSIDSHIGETFNFLMNNIIVFCEYDKNPITFMVSVINNNSRWVLHSIYVHNIQYEGHLSTEDIHSITSDNLKTYAYNDVLGQIKTLAYHKISQAMTQKNTDLSIDIDDENNDVLNKIVDMNKRIDSIKILAPIHHCLTFPLLSDICDIPYYHLKTIEANHASIISMYLYDLLSQVFSNNFKYFFDILNYGVLKEPSISTTFQIKYGDKFINKANNHKFYSFKSKTILHKLICHFIGVINRCKDGYINLKTGEIRDGFQINNLEPEIIDFYIYYCAGKFEKEVDKMRKLLYAAL